MAFGSDGLWREVEIQGHFAARCGGIVSEFEELASKGSDCSCSIERHFMVYVDESTLDEKGRSICRVWGGRYMGIL